MTTERELEELAARLKFKPPTGKGADSIDRATARINLWHGSVRSSKTVASMMRWLTYVLDDAPPGELAMAGKSERTLKRNVLDPLEELLAEWIGKRAAARALTTSFGEGEAHLFGRRLYLFGANDMRAEAKIRGLTLAGLYADEVTTWPEAVWKMALSRLSVPGAKLFATTNPEGPYHWLKRDYIDREDELDLRAFHFTLADNPHLDPAYVAAIAAEYTGLWHARFIQGRWVAAEGAIYDELDPDVGGRHVVAEVPAGLTFRRYAVGIDYGTTNPFHAVLVGYDHQGRAWVLSEWEWDARARGRQRTNVQYVEAVKAWLAEELVGEAGEEGPLVSAVWVDPSANSFLLECQAAGLPAQAANNAVADGIQTVSSAVAGDRLLLVAGRTDVLAGELTDYVWDERAQKLGEDKPKKVNDHGPDALRYVLHSEATGIAELGAPVW